MTSSKFSSLLDWYLARLRHNAGKALQQKLTPVALLETDTELIKNLVRASGPSREEQSAKLRRSFDEETKKLYFLQNVILWTGIAFCIYFLVLLFAQSSF